MPNITRGIDVAGLVRYLFGPGRRNEHTDPYIVAAAEGMSFPDAYTPDGEEVALLAQELDAPHRMFRTRVRDGHVWHCSLSLKADEGELTSQQWAEAGRRMVDAMGFSDASGRSPCRWAVVHHGKSVEGNDHVHLVVDLVREDGTKADVFRDWPRSQRACTEIERAMGLRVVEGRVTGRTLPGIKPGEAEVSARRGRSEPERRTVAREVRAAAIAARDEADFVRLSRARGLLVRGRYAPGGRESVVGYSVALRPPKGSAPVWWGGGKLARDLTLSQLRERWPDSLRAEAVDMWNSPNSTRPPLPRIPAVASEAHAWEAVARQMASTRSTWAEVPAAATTEWSRAADELAAVFAAWSLREEAVPGPLARAADVLARSAQVPHGHHHQGGGRSTRTREVVLVILFGSKSSVHGAVGQWAMLRQMRNGMKAVHDMHAARRELQAARAVEDSARGDLARLQEARRALADSPGALPGPYLPPPDRSKGPGHDSGRGY